MSNRVEELVSDRVTRSEDPELDMEVEELDLAGCYGARIRLLSQRSIKEEEPDGDWSEYAEMTVEVDADFFLTEDIKEEESFETEEITYQVTSQILFKPLACYHLLVNCLSFPDLLTVEFS